ncbi:MAG: hypothetical protein H7210_03785 [Pyrinomonadaceae bacterium]|nr:hypothetical protein [Phycisphaerales bacterium]
MTIRRWVPISTTILLALGASLAGCASETSRDAMIRADVTPELVTLHERQVDSDNAGALMADENGRMFWQDMGRAFYTDRASHLSPNPSPRP